jgi:hypothetical protein
VERVNYEAMQNGIFLRKCEKQTELGDSQGKSSTKKNYDIRGDGYWMVDCTRISVISGQLYRL